MDGWLKALIAAACVVVIVGGGYYFWSEHNNAQIRQANESTLAAQALERAQKAKLTGAYCNSLALSALSKVNGQDFRTPDRVAEMKMCNELNRLGYVEKRDLDAAGLL